MKKIKIGLVGLPNVGKSTIFKILTNKDVFIANYPFSTINPNIGTVQVIDDRLKILENFFESKSIVYDYFEIIDIAGIIKGASNKVGLGGEFLSHVRNLDIICHVVRCFDDNEIIHVDSKIDSVRDISTIFLEFIMSDIFQIEKNIEKLKKILKKSFDKNIKDELSLLEKLNYDLQKEVFISDINWLNDNDKEIIKKYNFITNKPFLVIANFNGYENFEIEKLIENYDSNFKIFPFAAKIEYELKNISQEDKNEIGWNFSFDFNHFFNHINKLLKLKTFFTAGKNEVRSWIVESKYTAIDCAGMIHSDVKNKFIKVEIYNLKDIKDKKYNQNNLKKESSTYLIKDGDVCNFIFNKGK